VLSKSNPVMQRAPNLKNRELQVTT